MALASLLCRVIGHRYVVTRTAGGNPRVTCPRCRSRLLYVSGGVIWMPEWR